MRLSVADFERDALEALEVMTREYYAGGADDEVTLRANVSAWRDVALRYRVLAGIGDRSNETTVLGITHLHRPLVVRAAQLGDTFLC